MLAESLPKPNVWSVSDLTRRIKGTLEREVGQVWVAGEISNWKVSPTGHAYFTLKDAHSQIDGVMFRGKLMRLKFRPESGLAIIAGGMVSVYERRGNYQIICDTLQPQGLGALQLAFEKLKRQLAEEGLFDEAHKQPLPLLPRRIGIVTSPTGAAIRDILHVLRRRFANVHVLLYPTRVQGDEAAAGIVRGIEALEAYGVDVMIVGRGGGSLEDLWPFNEEAVVRAVFAAKTPIISAVGHEVDFALTDFAADVRAPTPSAAAELVVREQRELAERIAQLRQRAAQALGRQLEQVRHRVAMAGGHYALRRPDELVREHRQRADDLRERLDQALHEVVQDRRQRTQSATRSLALLSPDSQLRRARERLAALRERLKLAGGVRPERDRARLRHAVGRLEALSPLAILSRGYALAFDAEGALVRRAGDLQPGDRLYVRLGEGAARTTVDQTEEEPRGPAEL